MKKKILLSALLILTCTLTACGKKDRKDIEKDLGGSTTENTGTSDKMSDEEIPEHLSYMVANTAVEADVSADGYGELPVYKVKKKEKNDEWIKSYAEVFFDGGEYVNVKPYEFCTKDELEAEKEFWEEQLSEPTEEEAEYQRIQEEVAQMEEEIEKEQRIQEELEEGLQHIQEETGQPEDEVENSADRSVALSVSEPADEEDRYPRIQQEISTLEYEIERSADRDVESYPEDKLICEANYSYEEEGEVSDSRIERALLRGEADGDTWQLIYDYDEIIINGEKNINNDAILYGVCPEKAKSYQMAYGIDAGIYNNLCSRATAEADAEKLLDRLGFHDMEQLSIRELNPQVNRDGNYVGADYCDGYAIVYAPAFGNVKASMNMTSAKAYNIVETDAEGTVDTEIFAVQPRIGILVNSEGVFSFCIMEDYEIEETLTVNPAMLTFEQIDSIAKAEFEKAGDSGYATVTKVNFGYMYITYDGISYAVVPVWSYCTEYTYMTEKNYIPLINICALDGTIIQTIYTNFNYEYLYFID